MAVYMRSNDYEAARISESNIRKKKKFHDDSCSQPTGDKNLLEMLFSNLIKGHRY